MADRKTATVAEQASQPVSNRMAPSEEEKSKTVRSNQVLPLIHKKPKADLDSSSKNLRIEQLNGSDKELLLEHQKKNDKGASLDMKNSDSFGLFKSVKEMKSNRIKELWQRVRDNRRSFIQDQIVTTALQGSEQPSRRRFSYIIRLESRRRKALLMLRSVSIFLNFLVIPYLYAPPLT